MKYIFLFFISLSSLYSFSIEVDNKHTLSVYSKERVLINNDIFYINSDHGKFMCKKTNNLIICINKLKNYILKNSFISNGYLEDRYLNFVELKANE